jgi:signal transduction histidine kinase
MTRRLLLSYLAITVIVLVVLEVPLGIVYATREEDRLAVAAERDATVLATYYEDLLEGALAAELGEGVDASLAEDYAIRTGTRVVVVDAEGISVIDTAADIAANRDFSTRDEIAAALTGAPARGIRRSDTLDTDLWFVTVPVASGGMVWGAVRITINTREMGERVQQFWLGLAGTAAVVLVAITAIGWAIARSITRPVRSLQAAAGRFARGDLEPSEPDPGAPAELRQLQRDLDSMADQLDRLLERQRAFVADASHQLRTPLTAIRLRLENLSSALDGREGCDDVDAAIDETDRLTTLVADLLTLARAERQPDPVEVELTTAARDRADTWSAMAETRGVTVELDVPAGPVRAMAVAGAVEQILDNLIDNAVAASPPGGAVTIAVTEEDTGRQLTVSDEGSGLDDEQKSRALDRFWRAANDRPGTGLGLSIVAALTNSAGGSIRLADNQPSGLAVTVELPPADGACDR